MLKKKLFKHTLIYALGSIVVNGGGFLLIPLYTKYLSPADYGIWGSVTILVSFLVAILGFGINGIINRYYYEFEDKTKWQLFFGSISKFILIFGVASTAILFFWGAPVLDLIFKSVRFDPYLKLGVLIGFLSVLPVIGLSVFQAKQQVLTYRFFTTLTFICFTLCMITLVVILKKGVMGVLYAQLISGLIMGLLFVYFIFKEGLTGFSFKDLGASLQFGLPLMLYVITGSMTEMASRYFVERFTSLSVLGIFNLAQQYASGLIMVVTAINMAWAPIFFERAKDPSAKEQFSKFGFYLIFLVVFMGLVMSLFAPEFLRVMASSQYYGAYRVAPILLLSYVFGNGFWSVMIPPIMFMKKSRYMPWLTIASGTVCVSLNYFLVPVWGSYGAAVSQLIGYMVLAYLAYRVSNKIFPISYPFLKIGSILLLSVAIFLVGLLVNRFGVFLAVSLKMALVGCFVFILWALRIISIPNLMSLKRFFLPVPNV